MKMLIQCFIFLEIIMSYLNLIQRGKNKKRQSFCFFRQFCDRGIFDPDFRTAFPDQINLRCITEFRKERFQKESSPAGCLVCGKLMCEFHFDVRDEDKINRISAGYARHIFPPIPQFIPAGKGESRKAIPAARRYLIFSMPENFDFIIPNKKKIMMNHQYTFPASSIRVSIFLLTSSGVGLSRDLVKTLLQRSPVSLILSGRQVPAK